MVHFLAAESPDGRSPQPGNRMLAQSVSEISPVNPDKKRCVIVGSGAMGFYAASLLIDAGYEVVLVEAGSEHLGQFPEGSYSCVGRKHDGIAMGRSRTLGGTTNLWGGQLVEFQPADFGGRSSLPRSQWPVTFEEFSPFYRQTFINLGIPEDMIQDPAAWKAVGTTPDEFPNDLRIVLTRWMGVPNFAELFRQKVTASSDAYVLIGQTAVDFSGGGSKVSELVVKSAEGVESTISGDMFFMAAGTIENARLLLAAAQSKRWTAPWKENDMVGRFFQDHLGGLIGTIKPAPGKRFSDLFTTLVVRGKFKFKPKLRYKDDALLKGDRLGVLTWVEFESSVSEHLVYLRQFLKAAIFSRRFSGAGAFFKSLASSVRYLPPLMWRYMVDHRVFVPSNSSAQLFVQAEQVSLPESRITVDWNSLDKFGLPKAVLDWRIEGREIDSIKNFALLCKETLEASNLGKVELNPDLVAGKPEFLDKLRDTNHPSGGLIMGNSAEDGVVDSNLKVFGTDNLYVLGASVFPTSSAANVTFTALTFVTRLANHLTISASQRSLPVESTAS